MEVIYGQSLQVTPFAGVWIEIVDAKVEKATEPLVTPFAGVWIEIVHGIYYILRCPVTPFAGVWIEIAYLPYLLDSWHCHSLRGSVD